jgi:hypothetical protein
MSWTCSECSACTVTVQCRECTVCPRVRALTYPQGLHSLVEIRGRLEWMHVESEFELVSGFLSDSHLTVIA